MSEEVDMTAAETGGYGLGRVNGLGPRQYGWLCWDRQSY